jgi:hypothetical protein
VGTQVQDTAGLQVLVGNTEDRIDAEGSVPGQDIDVEGGIEFRKLCEQCGHGRGFGFIGGAEVVGEDETETSLGIDQKQRQGAIAVDKTSPSWFLFVGVAGFVGAVIGLVVAFVNDKASFLVTRGGETTGAGAGQGVTSAALLALFLGGTGTGSGLVTTGVDGGTAQARSCLMEHAIWTNLGLLPGIGAEYASLTNQRHRLGDDVVQLLAYPALAALLDIEGVVRTG